LNRAETVLNFGPYNLESREIEIEFARSQTAAQQFKLLFERVQVSWRQFLGLLGRKRAGTGTCLCDCSRPNKTFRRTAFQSTPPHRSRASLMKSFVVRKWDYEVPQTELFPPGIARR
jgi:hypothetical protein